MSYKVLYRKYRPNDFENVVGQSYTKEMLKSAILTGKTAHAYIFTGPRGTGKTSSAKVFAKALNCEHPVNGNPCNECSSCLSFKDNPDIIEIDAASNNGVDQIRELINNVKLVPSGSKFKVYIIDEVHMLTDQAFNALLLTLEEPPSHVVFILATTDIQDVPITILSRCQRFDFRPIAKEDIVAHLKNVCSEEAISITDEALEEIALISAGGMRDALGMLDQLSSTDSEITLDVVSNYFGSVSVKKIDELLTSISDNNVASLIEILGNVKESGTNYSVFLEKFIDELRKIAIDIKVGNTKYKFYYEDIYNMIFDLNECLCNININIDPYVLIEVVLLKYVKQSTISSISTDSISTNNVLIEEKVSSNDSKTKLVVSPEKENIELKNDSIKDTEIKSEVINKQNKHVINLDVRINNCFVNASKIKKNEISESWVDFMNFLMVKDRNLVSLLADTTILTASDRYALIQSKIDSTNELINSSTNDLERFYEEFSGNKYRFAAISEDLWLKETEKYRFNLKNKIKYNYIDEEDESSSGSDESTDGNIIDENDIESLAKDIFGTFEVE